MAFTQDFRVARLLTPLSDNTLVLTEFSGTEFINEISNFRIRCVAERQPVDLDDILGKPVTVDFKTAHGDRWFNLTVFAARFLGRQNDLYFYEFEARPWFWALSRRENSRIFHDLKVDDIITEILGEYAGLDNSAHEFSLRNALPTLEYVVQYRESDLTFVRRLLEEYGINFHLRMEQTRQVLVMSDSTDGFIDVPGGSRPFVPETGNMTPSGEFVRSWLSQRMLTTGAVRMTDYDFMNPGTSLEVTQSDPADYANGDFESYDYPGRYLTATDGTLLARRRRDAFRMANATVRADGGLLSLGAGMMLTLTGQIPDGADGKHVCLSAHHHFVDGGYRSGGQRVENTYDGYYALTKESAPIAPERVTPRGQVRGPHTAVVVDGMDGRVDEWGRIIVRFHWDTNAQSMRCRVSQMWAGAQWGTIFVPRAGMEVIVEFLEGDPDRPIVVGCVYNADNMPPYTLPDEKQISGFKTQTMDGSGYNELIFDDTSGAELIRIHGQMDLEVTIENDETHEIRNDSKRKILGNRTDTISKNQNTTVNQSQSTTVQGARTVTVNSTETKKVKDKLEISSETKIELKVGPSSITIDATGIKITAIKVEILASAQLETNGSAMAKHTSGGVVQIQGPLVTIN